MTYYPYLHAERRKWPTAWSENSRNSWIWEIILQDTKSNMSEPQLDLPKSVMCQNNTQLSDHS